ncbi:MAG: PQQ-binding-like beta-propeller repeat protein [Planctomycetaceae bacterium]|nr:PQQ-binding-like beta-propeller repeat protein [Planctomycetaceae bacterium]
MARLATGTGLVVAALAAAAFFRSNIQAAESIDDAAVISARRGICVVLEKVADSQGDLVGQLARDTEWVFLFQASSKEAIEDAYQFAYERKLLGSRVFIEPGSADSIHLGSNLADLVFVPADAPETPTEEILRVLRPGGVAHLDQRAVTKPIPEGVDSWSHPYHSPDNNPQSADRLARAPYLTQFLGCPMFSPMPEVTVAAGGRIFRACGHIAHKKNQNEQLNTLFGINAYNGSILWTRPLAEGFMIHRNTMIATPEVLYLADNQSCKLIDTKTGETLDEIVINHPDADGPVWKWMALVDGTLYVLAGGKEAPIHTQRSETPGMGHWPWGMWEGHDYADPETSFGFGRTLLAVNPKSKEVLWTHREEQPLDSRAVCMIDGRIYAYCPEKSLVCVSAWDGKPVWRNSDADLLEAIGPNGKAQHYITGYATQTYMKAGPKHLVFAGPQRARLVVASTEDGRLLWTKDRGNLQIVLRDDGFYAAGAQDTDSGFKFSYDGEILAKFTQRRACTRATGALDSIFFRANGGTVRVETASNSAKHIAPMRPPCQDGVIISDGHLFWGPWMCGCQLSAYGHVGLGPAGDFDFHPGLTPARLAAEASDLTKVEPLPGAADWPAYQGDSSRSMSTKTEIADAVEQKWMFQLPDSAFPTAPITAGGLVFFADRNGVVHAVKSESGEPVWKSFTAGPVYFPPAYWNNRLYVGSADGRVYALEAATGKTLWTFQAAPANQRIPVYGKLISRWPVAGGVVVEDGTVYAAAGMAHYDGIHVYAMDGITGEVKWYNDTSGTISEVTDSGVSLQGELFLKDGELRFLGGGAYEFARYDMKTGKCLNEPRDEPNSSFHTAFYAYYPEYGKYVSLDYALPGGRDLVYDASYEGSQHSELSLMEPLPEGTPKPYIVASRWGFQRQRRGAPERKRAWVIPAGPRYNAFIVGPDKLLAAGHTGDDDQTTSALAAVSVETGKIVWMQQLPAAVVKNGLALDSAGRVFVTLVDGRVVCYGS